MDYRPALRARTGVGEYIHELVKAYAAIGQDDVAVFTSSWKDRPAATLAKDLGASVVDRRIPVSILNYLWHRCQWPPVESLAGECSVVHAAHPLRIPARHAAQVVTIHDLFFMTAPEQTRSEIRRDYAALAPQHARSADAVVTSTNHGKRLIESQLGVPSERIYVCPAGAPAWTGLGRRPHVPDGGYVLFVGTLEPRKNVGALLDAWELLGDRGVSTPLVLAGAAPAGAAPLLARVSSPPLAGRVEYRGYVPAAAREALYAGARAIVLPSLDEGFGLTALEAMSAGIPLVASNRGSLPEVAGDAGALVDPTDVRQLADALERVLRDRAWALERAESGLARSRAFRWDVSARTLRQAYLEAVARKHGTAVEHGAHRN